MKWKVARELSWVECGDQHGVVFEAEDGFELEVRAPFFFGDPEFGRRQALFMGLWNRLGQPCEGDLHYPEVTW